MILMVRAIAGEPTCFEVESFHLQCANPRCQKTIKRFPDLLVEFSARQRAVLQFVGVWNRVAVVVRGLRAKAFRQPGDPCPRCGGALEARWHKVDIARCDLNGECGCEHFQMTLFKELKRLTKAQRALGPFRCAHIEAAREFALDVAVAGHEKQRLLINGRNGQKEEHAA